MSPKPKLFSSNKDLDSTILLVGILASFILFMIFSYMNPEFRKAESSAEIAELFENSFLLMLGFFFKGQQMAQSAENKRREVENENGSGNSKVG